MSTVGILVCTVLNTALGSRQGQEEVSLQNRAWGGGQSRAGDSRGQRGTGLQGSSSNGNSRAILVLLENETKTSMGAIPCIQCC